jgi:cytochrome c556
MGAIPPTYQALAMAHVQAGKELAAIMPSRDMKQILPRFNAMLKTCMACHLEFRSEGTRSH